MTEQCFELTLTIHGPLLIAGALNQHWSIDKRSYEYDGHWAIPGSLVSGVIRHAFIELGLDTTLWGTASQDSQNTPNRGKLNFPFAFIGPKVDQNVTRTSRIRINDQHVAERGAFSIAEAALDYAESADFSGLVYAQSDDPMLAAKFKDVLLWVGAIGAQKSTGFGRIVKAKTELRPQATAVNIATSSPHWQLSLNLDRPYLFASQRRSASANDYHALAHIPGSAIAARIAASFQTQHGNVPDWFDKIVFGHLHAEDRPSIFPKSIVQTSTGFACAAHNDINDHLGFVEFKKPAVKRNARQALLDGSASFPTELLKHIEDVKTGAPYSQVRNTIREHSSVVVDQGLFSYHCQSHCLENGDLATFIGAIDVSKLSPSELTTFKQQLEYTQWYPLGKTDAIAQNVSITDLTPPSELPDASSYVITLISDACLQRGGDQCGYANYFSRFGMRLEATYSSEHFSGGEYLAKRFDNGKPYQPWLITEAGSVFVVSGESDLKATLDQWQRDGLPAYEASIDDDPLANPFARQNGYGAIRVTCKGAKA